MSDFTQTHTAYSGRLDRRIADDRRFTIDTRGSNPLMSGLDIAAFIAAAIVTLGPLAAAAFSVQ